MQNAELVTVENNQRVTTSLIIAQEFNKRHDHVLALIEERLSSPEISGRLSEWITPTFYTDANNQQRKMYNITEDGFIFVVTSFKGRKADLSRIEFIKAFSQLRNQVQQLNNTPVPLIDEPEVISNLKVYTTEFQGRYVRYVYIEDSYNKPAFFLYDLKLALGYSSMTSLQDINRAHFRYNGIIYNLVTLPDLLRFYESAKRASIQLDALGDFLKIEFAILIAKIRQKNEDKAKKTLKLAQLAKEDGNANIMNELIDRATKLI